MFMGILRKVYKFVIKLLLRKQKASFHVEYGKGETGNQTI
jgi:hypothetical protein